MNKKIKRINNNINFLQYKDGKVIFVNRKNIIFISLISTSVVIGVIILIMCGFFIKNSHNTSVGELNSTPDNKELGQNNVISKQTAMEESKKVSPNAKIEMTQYFEECGHIVKDEYKVPKIVVNMDEEQLKEYYKGWELKSFSSDYIKIYKTSHEICSEHYIIRDVDGYVNIFVLNKKGEEVLFRATDILCKYLSDRDKVSLENGITVVGKDEMEKMIEDLE